jgi:hypothetical protein
MTASPLLRTRAWSPSMLRTTMLVTWWPSGLAAPSARAASATACQPSSRPLPKADTS